MSKHPAVAHRLSPERWKTLEPLVDAAIALTQARRQRFLDDACGGDAALRAELEWMVAECERSDDALDQPAVERFGTLLDAFADVAEIPRVLAGRFRIERELGRGGMATVYLAHDLKHAREVAVKMVRPELAAILGGERFLAEIRVTATLRHPHILPLFDSGEADGCIYFVMPYVDGGTVRDHLMREGTLARADALRIARQVAEGLASAHEQGTVHRDVKPENILLAAGGRHAYVTDFGIALAKSRAEGDRASGSWLRLGTPSYMSPEQLQGGVGLDGRTDVYSLGRVLYEMLVGTLPPRPWPGSSASNRQSGARWWKLRRRGIDGSLERLMSRALEHAPADRFQTASEFAHALAAAASDSGIERSKSRWRLVGAAAGVVAIAAAAAASPAARATIRGWLDADVDPELTVVLPFRSDSSGLAVLSGDNAARLLYDALGRWKDLKLGDEMGAVEAGRRNGVALTSVSDAWAVARHLGAGRFVWGEVSDQRGVTRISAQMYDQRRPTRPVTHAVYVSASDGAAAKIQEVADSLVAKLVEAPAAGIGTSGTHMFAALKRYAEGYAALHDWNTQLAEQEFRGAVDLDPHFAQAWLGVAQSMAWSGLHRASEWLEPASRAVADSNTLGPRDRLLASGLLALAEWRMADACDVYRRLIARDPRDFAAHYGLGDCLSMDRLVVADRASRTGWKFRGSLHTAIQEYRRALELVPSYLEGSRGQTFARLTDRVLWTDIGGFRRGFTLTPDTVWMGAAPEIANDTLAFYPLPQAAFVSAPEPRTHREAVDRNRQLLRALTARWVEVFPRSASAQAQYAVALEALGALDTLDVSRQGAGALGAIERARRVADGDSIAVLRFAATHVRLLLKLHRFGSAQALADSTLALRTAPTGQEASVLAPLAALTGRSRLTARLLSIAAVDSSVNLFTNRRSGGRMLSTAVLSAGGTFAGYAAFGAPPESLRAALSRVERVVRSSVSTRDLDAVRADVLLPISYQAEPALGLSTMTTLRAPRTRLLLGWQLLARDDTAGARQIVARNGMRMAATDVIPAPDVSLQYALLALAVRDTTSAVALLDRVVSALAELEPRLTTEAAPAAALPRVLLLRARLARGPQAERAALWSLARVLWSRADADLRAAVDSLGAAFRVSRSNGDSTQLSPEKPQ